MNRLLLIKFFLLFISGTLFYSGISFATHNRAGEITYKHINNLTYEITITTYTKEASIQADRCELEINFGDGIIDTIKRVNGTVGTSGCPFLGESLGNDIKKNVYTTTHTFPGIGTYTISVEDPNRNSDILNIPNSVNTTFFIKSTLIISPFTGYNNSPVLSQPPIDMGCVFKCFLHNPGAIDPDGDSLSYSLIACLGTSGQTIVNYKFPDQISPGPNNYMTLDKYNGTLIWCSPQLQGEYNVCILIEEFRNGAKIGSVLRDMQITIKTCNNDPPAIVAPVKLCVLAGEKVDTLITASDINNDYITLTATGDPVILPNNAVFNQPVNGTGFVSEKFTWQTNCNNIRKSPYQIFFKAEDNASPVSLVDFKTMDIEVIGPAPQNPSATPSGNSILLSWSPPPCSNVSCYKIYRNTDSSGFVPGPCQTGVPANSGYTLIATTNSLYDTTFSDNLAGSGLIHGQKYCYIIVACYNNGSVDGIASEEFCTELKKDVPVITHVTINTTSKLSGTDSVIWSMPTELDTITQHPGPYKYIIYRNEGSGSFIKAGETNLSPGLALTDTFFVDTALNTLEKQFTYKVELYYKNGDSLVGSTNTASSIFLTSTPTDNKLILLWNEKVPWVNNKYEVYKKNDITGLFDYLATTSTQTYTDTGLINGAEYCYYVKSRGYYSAPGLINPIINRSQEHCARPYDNVPPCPPSAKDLSTNCEKNENTFSWNKPNLNCADDVVGYNIYFTPIFGGPLNKIFSITSSGETVFVNGNMLSVAGCYAVTAIDTFFNESPLSDTICTDNCPVYELPNIFSPGGDGINDLLKPFPYKFVHSIYLQVYNRWGQVVFETNNPDIKWDGVNQTSKQKCSSGVYYYICQVHEIRLRGIETRVLKGYIHLINEENPSTQGN